jgi:hypothetical protein
VTAGHRTSSADGSVTVTVDPAGGIRALRLTAFRHAVRAEVDGQGGGTLRLLGFVHEDPTTDGRTS